MTKNIIIAVLALALCISFFFVHKEKSFLPSDGSEESYGTIHFWQPVNDSTVKSDMAKYRNQLTLRKKSYGVIYDDATVKIYVDSVYTKLIASYVDPPKGYVWKMGFYFVRKLNEEGKRKLDFYVIPTLITPKGEVLDFFDPKNAVYYTPKIKRTGKPKENEICDTCNAYDAGHLWP